MSEGKGYECVCLCHMVTEEDIKQLIQKYPERRFFIHSGYSGWSYGSPLNPTFITASTARDILNTLVQFSHEEVLRLVAENDPPLLYAEEGDDLYERTGDNRFIAFLNPSICAYDETYQHAGEKNFLIK